MRIRQVRPVTRQRRGATLVEAAIVLPVFLALVLGMLDLGIGVLRYHLVGEAARLAARQAAVRGADDPHDSHDNVVWSTSDPNPNTEAEAVIGPLLAAAGLGSDEYEVHVVFTDGPDDGSSRNDPGDTVEVTVTTDYTPVVPLALGNATRTLTGRSRMPIQD